MRGSSQNGGTTQELNLKTSYKLILLMKEGRKEGNVLVNDTLNTFYLRLYGSRHMVNMEHWLEREIAQWVHHMKDRSDDPSHHEQTPLPLTTQELKLKTSYKLILLMKIEMNKVKKNAI